MTEAERKAWEAGRDAAAKAAQGSYSVNSKYDVDSVFYGHDLTPDRSDWGRGIQRGREQAADALPAPFLVAH